jgi:hypothetical protein
MTSSKNEEHGHARAERGRQLQLLDFASLIASTAVTRPVAGCFAAWPARRKPAAGSPGPAGYYAP